MGYWITAYNGVDKIDVSDIYIHKAEIYKSVEEIDLMCEQLNRACDLTDCNSDKYMPIKQRIASECK